MQCCSETIDQHTHTGLRIREKISPRSIDAMCSDLHSPNPNCLFHREFSFDSPSEFTDFGAGGSGGDSQVLADANLGGSPQPIGTGGSGEISTQASDLSGSGPLSVGISNPPTVPVSPSTGDTATALINPSTLGQSSDISTITPPGNTLGFDATKSPFSNPNLPTIADTTSPAPVPPSTPDIAPNTPAVQAVTPPATVPDSSPNQPIIPNAISAAPAPVSLPNTAFNSDTTVPNIRLNSINNALAKPPPESTFDSKSNAIVTYHPNQQQTSSDPNQRLASSNYVGPTLGINPSTKLLSAGYQGSNDGVTISPVYPAGDLLVGPGDFFDKLTVGGRIDYTHRFGPHKA